MANTMNKFLTNKYLVFLIRLAIGIVFVYAAISKITHPDQFARIIYNYHILPGGVINLFALFLPWIEILCGFLLVMGFWHKSAAVTLGGVTVVFIIALSVALFRGVNIECGCFSTTSKAKGPVIDLIVRDTIMLVGCALIFAANKTFLALDSLRRRF
jgi:putative oxidoreductase